MREVLCSAVFVEERKEIPHKLVLPVKKVNSFVQGTTNFKLETIKDHEISKAHRSNSLKVRNRDKPVQETPAGVALSSLNKVQMDRVKLLMRNTHAIMKNARPFTDYEWMCR